VFWVFLLPKEDEKMGSVPTEVNVDNILSKLTLKEKVSLLAAKDWWRTPIIKRDGVFVPHIKVRTKSPWETGRKDIYLERKYHQKTLG
jgi:hypothetical protein